MEIKECPYCKEKINKKAKICPYCHSKLKSRIWSIAIIIMFIITIVIIRIKLYYEEKNSYNEYDDTYEKIKELERINNNLRFSLKESHISEDSNEFATYIEGKVENNLSDNLDYVSITFYIYDSEGNNIGSCYDNNSGLNGYGIWKFKAICFEGIDKIDHYELKEITD